MSVLLLFGKKRSSFKKRDHSGVMHVWTDGRCSCSFIWREIQFLKCAASTYVCQHWQNVFLYWLLWKWGQLHYTVQQHWSRIKLLINQRLFWHNLDSCALVPDPSHSFYFSFYSAVLKKKNLQLRIVSHPGRVTFQTTLWCRVSTVIFINTWPFTQQSWQDARLTRTASFTSESVLVSELVV